MAQIKINMEMIMLDEEKQDIIKTLIKYPDGASISDIMASLNLEISRRTLIRRLHDLAQIGVITRNGLRKGIRYSLVPGHFPELTLEPNISTKNIINEIEIPLSREGQSVRNYIQKPFHLRKPVGYNVAFLENYIPNVTSYLPKLIQEHLKKIGTIPDSHHFAGTYTRRLLHRLLIDLSWNSSRLEGNTYSLLETERLIDIGEAGSGKSFFETQMILNHKAAIEFLVEENQFLDFNRSTILNLHGLLSENLLGNPEACGRLRSIPVGINKTVYHPLEIPQLIDEYLQIILEKAKEITDPFEQSFFVFIHFAYLQPFEDVNKRVSRLSANIPLIKKNLCPMSFIDVPKQVYIDGILGVYELNRIELARDVFIWAYERSADKYAAVRQSLGEPDQFILKFRSEIKELVHEIVNDNYDKKSTIQHIYQWTRSHISEPMQQRFIEVIERELLALHEGNIARYRIKPSIFEVWRKKWKEEM